MVSAQNVEYNTIQSFNKLKTDVRTLARWVAWNKHEHDLLKHKIALLEQRLAETNGHEIKLVASTKARRVHNEHCLHAKRIKTVNKTYFDLMQDARERGYSICECAA
jgi:hypothetical protein